MSISSGSGVVALALSGRGPCVDGAICISYLGVELSWALRKAIQGSAGLPES